MAVEEAVEVTERIDERQLPDLIVSKIVQLGCACTTDLAGQIGGGVKPKDLVATLNSLVEGGILRRKIDKDDPREYNEYQAVYELAR
jgi:DNA-binding HxlR family transcriptional regulator